MTTPTLWYLVGRFFLNIFAGKEEGRALRGSILGMALGLIPLLTVIVVADGMIDGITSRYRETLSYHLQAHPQGRVANDDIARYAAVFSGLPGIAGAWEERQGFGLAYTGGHRTGVTLRGLDPDFLRDPGWKRYISFSAGGPYFLGESNAFVGEEVARKLGVGLGDEMKILTTRRAEGRAFLPRITTLTVTGLFSTGYQDLDRLWVLLPLETARRVLPDGDYFSTLGVKTLPGYTPEDVLPALQNAVSTGWRVRTWFEINRNQYQNFQTTRTLLLVIMGMILLVSSVNISSSLLMTFLERRKELAILKSLGFSPEFIQRYFALLGLISGFAGTFLGMLAGIWTAINVNGLIGALEGFIQGASGALAWLTGTPYDPSFRLLDQTYYLETIPVRLDGTTLLFVAVLSLFFSVAASWFPAWKASRMKPLEILRKV